MWDGEGVAFAELGLVPVGVGERNGAGGVELGYLFGGELPAYGGEVLFELLFGTGSDDDGGDGGAAEDPVEGDLGDGLAGLGGDFVEGIDYLVEVFFGDLRAGVGDHL